MKLGITLCAGDSGRSGIGRCFGEVLKRIPDLLQDKDQLIIFIPAGEEQHFISDELLTKLSGRIQIHVISGFWASTLGNLTWHFFKLPGIARKYGIDLMLYPAANRRCSYTKDIAGLGVVHDLSQLHIKGKYDAFRTFYVLKLLPVILRRLNRIVTVSNSTADDVSSHIGVSRREIEVIYNGVDVSRYAAEHRLSAQLFIQRKLNLKEPYLLYTARLEHPGKNHITLLSAIAKMKAHGKLKHKLVLAGGRWNGAEVIESRVKELGLEEDVVFAGFVSEQELPALVAGADIFIFPSLFEGFGLPILEAFAAGTPVCASNVSSIPEVAGDAALMFNPDDSDDICKTLLEMLEMPELARILATRGRLRAMEFSWDDSASSLIDSCRRCMNAFRRSELSLRTGLPSPLPE